MGLHVQTLIGLKKSTDESGIWIANMDDFKDRNTLIEEGQYHVQKKVTNLQMSCSGYGDLRNEISLMAHRVEARDIWEDTPTYKGKDFWEIICFADNEGSIDSNVSGKLYQDFAKWDEAAKAKFGPFHYEQYQGLMNGFKLASEHNGVVVYG